MDGVTATAESLLHMRQCSCSCGRSTVHMHAGPSRTTSNRPTGGRVYACRLRPDDRSDGQPVHMQLRLRAGLRQAHMHASSVATQLRLRLSLACICTSVSLHVSRPAYATSQLAISLPDGG